MKPPAQKRIAIILFNLGGPDRPDSVRPFLFNLFNDPSIIAAPAPIRRLLAHVIAWRRAPIARAIYGRIGGGSPILENTLAQAQALEAVLGATLEATLRAGLEGPGAVKCFVAMRYWHPMIPAVAAEVKDWRPDEIVLLPLYPQFSTTTTGSSHREWQAQAARLGLTQRQRLVCCYPTEEGFVSALADLAGAALATAGSEAAALGVTHEPIVIFSAHGLPRKIVDRGDPYVAQVKESVQAVAARLNLARERWELAFQSRVGPLEWVGPATDAVITRHAREKRPLVIVPIAFVSEHSETLVELDIEYRHLAMREGAPVFVRAPAIGTHPAFIAGLARLAAQALRHEEPVLAGCGTKACLGQAQCAMLRAGS